MVTRANCFGYYFGETGGFLLLYENLFTLLLAQVCGSILMRVFR